jgi:hypothetical protein
MRAFRLAEALWERFGEAARRAGSDRGSVLREFVRWYVGEAGAKMPRRPSPNTPEAPEE